MSFNATFLSNHPKFVRLCLVKIQYSVVNTSWKPIRKGPVCYLFRRYKGHRDTLLIFAEFVGWSSAFVWLKRRAALKQAARWCFKHVSSQGWNIWHTAYRPHLSKLADGQRVCSLFDASEFFLINILIWEFNNKKEPCDIVYLWFKCNTVNQKQPRWSIMPQIKAT